MDVVPSLIYRWHQDVTEKLDVVPRQWFVTERVRENYLGVAGPAHCALIARTSDDVWRPGSMAAHGARSK